MTFINCFPICAAHHSSMADQIMKLCFCHSSAKNEQLNTGWMIKNKQLCLCIVWSVQQPMSFSLMWLHWWVNQCKFSSIYSVSLLDQAWKQTNWGKRKETNHGCTLSCCWIYVVNLESSRRNQKESKWISSWKTAWAPTPNRASEVKMLNTWRAMACRRGKNEEAEEVRH